MFIAAWIVSDIELSLCLPLDMSNMHHGQLERGSHKVYGAVEGSTRETNRIQTYVNLRRSYERQRRQEYERLCPMPLCMQSNNWGMATNLRMQRIFQAKIQTFIPAWYIDTYDQTDWLIDWQMDDIREADTMDRSWTMRLLDGWVNKEINSRYQRSGKIDKMKLVSRSSEGGQIREMKPKVPTSRVGSTRTVQLAGLQIINWSSKLVTGERRDCCTGGDREACKSDTTTEIHITLQSKHKRPWHCSSCVCCRCGLLPEWVESLAKWRDTVCFDVVLYCTFICHDDIYLADWTSVLFLVACTT